MSNPRIGVLALQGAFFEHLRMLEKLKIEGFEIRKKSDLVRDFSGLILPGGESTVIGKLLLELGLFHPLKKMIAEGIPVLGTCAGMVLLARELCDDSARHFACMDIKVKRNAYGRQLGSFYTEDEFKGLGKIPMTFIRAPYIEEAGENVEVLAVVDGKIVAARERNMLVTSFHPELNDDLGIHRMFTERIKVTG